MSDRKSTTTVSYRRHADPAPIVPKPAGKDVVFDRVIREFAAFYDGNLLGYRKRFADAEELANEAALAAARREAYKAGYMDGMYGLSPVGA